jgi:hypothetical protein
MLKKICFAAVAALFLAGAGQVFSGTPSCAPSRTDILNGQVENVRTPTCAPSRLDILNAEQ